MRQLKNNQKGYTIVELIIASSVFSVVLLGASAAMIQIGRMYYKGVIASRTQNTARAVADEISRAIQFSGESVTILDDPLVVGTGPESVPKGVFCVGNTRYTFLENAQINSDASQRTGYTNDHRMAHALWKDEVTNPETDCTRVGAPSLVCDNPGPTTDCVDPSLVVGEELLAEHMRLLDLNVQNVGQGLWQVDVVVAYGDDNVFDSNDATTAKCLGIVQGAQWCAVSTLSTNVYKRIQGD